MQTIDLRYASGDDVQYTGRAVRIGEWLKYRRNQADQAEIFLAGAFDRLIRSGVNVPVRINHNPQRPLEGRLELTADDRELSFYFEPADSAQERAFRQMGLNGYVFGCSIGIDLDRSTYRRSEEGCIWTDVALQELSFIESPNSPAFDDTRVTLRARWQRACR